MIHDVAVTAFHRYSCAASMKRETFEYTTPTDGGTDLLMYVSLAHSFTFLTLTSCDYRPCKVKADGNYLFPYWVAIPAVPHLRSYCWYKSIRIINGTLYSLTDFMLLYHSTYPQQPTQTNFTPQNKMNKLKIRTSNKFHLQ